MLFTEAISFIRMPSSGLDLSVKKVLASILLLISTFVWFTMNSSDVHSIGARESSMGHPYWHALLYGLTKIEDPEFPRNETQVFTMLSHDNSIALNTEEYYESAKEIYIKYVLKNPLEVISYYLNSSWKTIKYSFSRHEITLWVFCLCFMILLLDSIMVVTNQWKESAVSQIAGYVLFFIPGTTLTALVWPAVPSPDSLTASLILIITACMMLASKVGSFYHFVTNTKHYFFSSAETDSNFEARVRASQTTRK